MYQLHLVCIEQMLLLVLAYVTHHHSLLPVSNWPHPSKSTGTPPDLQEGQGQEQLCCTMASTQRQECSSGSS
jgi:hypothetical protein